MNICLFIYFRSFISWSVLMLLSLFLVVVIVVVRVAVVIVVGVVNNVVDVLALDVRTQ